MKFIALNHLLFRANKYPHGSGELFAAVPTVT
jgi:hypothetical protein